MIEVRPYQPLDFLAMRLQPAQSNLSFGGQTMENARNLGESTQCYSAIANGQVLACIGLIQFWPGRRLVWAYLSASAGAHLVALTWQVRRWLRYHGTGRLEAAIDPEFPESIRWAARLGFRKEGRMEQWIPGKDFDLYARVR